MKNFDNQPEKDKVLAQAETDYTDDIQKIIREENSLLRKRRAHLFGVEDANSLEENKFGIAFSGGGIRSASVSLGVVKRFSQLGILRKADYLSSVSGGGFANSYVQSTLHDDNNKELLDDHFIHKMETGGSYYLFSNDSKFIPPTLILILNVIQTTLVGLLNPIILVSSSLLLWYIITLLLKAIFRNVPLIGTIDVESFYRYLNSGVGYYFIPVLLLGMLGYYFLGAIFRLRIYQFFNKIILYFLILLFFIGSIILVDSLSGGLVENNNISTLVEDILFFFHSILISSIGSTLILSFLIVYLIIWLTTSPVGQWIIGQWKSSEDFSETFLYKWCTKIRSNEMTNNLGLFLLYTVLVIIILGTYNMYPSPKEPYSSDDFRFILDKYWVLAIHLLLLMILLGFATNINSTSLGRLYSDNLTKTFNHGKSIRISALHHHKKKGVCVAPYPLINCCLNLAPDPKSSNLTSDYFLLSPLFMGAYSTGYIKPSREISLAMAVRTSGAAINTGMGLFSNSILGMLIGLFNFRMGALLFNPIKFKERITYLKSLSRYRTPKLFRWIKEFVDLTSLHYFPEVTWWPRFYAKSLLTNNSIEDTLLDISDGGHLENLAVIELLRRRCKLIICFDNGMDGNYEFVDLKHLMKRTLIEMDLEIKFREGHSPFKYIKPTADSNWTSKKRFAIADILEYKRDAKGEILKDADGNLSTVNIGTFVYVRLALLKNLSPFKGEKMDEKGEETLDYKVYKYKKFNGEFPQHSTLDQFFSAIQFKAYYKLGQSLCDDLFPGSKASYTREELMNQFNK